MPIIKKFRGVYECAFCDYQVTSRKAIDLHRKYSHKVDISGEKRATSLELCGVCGKRFGTHIDISDHMRKNHPYRR